MHACVECLTGDACIECSAGHSIAVLTRSTRHAQFCWEQAKRLLLAKPQFDAAGVHLACVGVGIPESGLKFCKALGFPEAQMYCDPEARRCHETVRDQAAC